MFSLGMVVSIAVKVLAKIIFLVRAKVDLEIEGQEGAQANFNIAL